jgi:CubicO group peptidase (beta-lactamase class C family)
VLPPASSRAIAGTGARSPSPPPPPSSRAVEAGELAWDEPLAARLGPLLPRASASRWHPQWRGLTLLHLLSHRSGFARLDNDPEMDAFPPEEADPRASRLALTGLTLARPPEAAPGARFIYSNRNYIVAAAMLEAATGRPWEDLMRERLFAPLAMEGAGFGPPELFPRLLIPAKPIRANRRRFPRSSRSATPGGQASAASPIPPACPRRTTPPWPAPPRGSTRPWPR